MMADQELHLQRRAVAEGEGNQVEHAEGPLCGYRFLIIEDEVMQAWQLSGIVADMGGTVEMIAYSFSQAREALEKTEFDCAIVDLNLAGTYAYHIAETLRRRRIAFVFCSAYADNADVFAGLSDVPRLAKPVDPDDLCKSLLCALQQSPAKQR
jgi:two-component SAPR family response regulator